MWKFQKFTLITFSQKFREINGFTIELHYMIFLRNIFQVIGVKLSFFHTVSKGPPYSTLTDLILRHFWAGKFDLPDKIASSPSTKENKMHQT